MSQLVIFSLFWEQMTNDDHVMFVSCSGVICLRHPGAPPLMFVRALQWRVVFVFLSHLSVHVLPDSQERERRRQGIMGSYDGKSGPVLLSSLLESSLKGLERWCRWLLPSPQPPGLMFFSSSDSGGEAQQQNQSLVLAKLPHVHQSGTRHWLHPTEKSPVVKVTWRLCKWLIWHVREGPPWSWSSSGSPRGKKSSLGWGTWSSTLIVLLVYFLLRPQK